VQVAHLSVAVHQKNIIAQTSLRLNWGSQYLTRNPGLDIKNSPCGFMHLIFHELLQDSGPVAFRCKNQISAPTILRTVPHVLLVP
jgi:hypothetical protein